MTTTFINGKILLSKSIQQDEAKFVSCLSIKDGAITYIGTEPDGEKLSMLGRGPDNKIVDLAGRTVLPGFIDGHIHLWLLGQALQKVDLTPCTSLADIRATIRAYADENSYKERILCRGWMHSMTAATRQVDKAMLDDIDPLGRPIYIDSKDLHSAWCNSAAIAEMGISHLDEPEGGKIHLDNEGNPSGLIEEVACVSIVWPFLATKATDMERMGGIFVAVRSMSACGYTGAIDMAMDEGGWKALLAMQSQFNDPIPLRIAAHWFIHPKDSEEETLRQVDRAIELSRQFDEAKSPDLKIVGIKMMCDGVVDACTAHLVEPYSHYKAHPAPLWKPAALEKVVRKADESGLQCALHAIGDGAVKLALNTLEKAATKGRRHRIEHLELTSPEDARRLAELGVTASVQAVHADPAILKAWPKLLGQERCARAFAYHEFLAAGANVALGTDAPTAPHEATGNIYVATTRRSVRIPDMLETVNEEYRLSLYQAIVAATAGSAYSCFAEKKTGKLEVGMMADLAILDMEWEAGKMLEAKVKETWFGGRKVFQASE